jgi:hypothetical protein
MTHVDYSYRIGVRGNYSDEMMALGDQNYATMVMEDTERRLRDAMAERMLTDAIGLINPDVQEVIVTSHMPEVMVIHPRLYAQLLGSLSMNSMSDRWFPPPRV